MSKHGSKHFSQPEHRVEWQVIEPWLTLSASEGKYAERLQQGDFEPELLFKGNRRMINRVRLHTALLEDAERAAARATKPKDCSRRSNFGSRENGKA